MEVHFTPEQEMLLAQLATRTGTDPEHLVIVALSGMLGFVQVLPAPARTVTILMELLRRHPSMAVMFSICKSWRLCKRTMCKGFTPSNTGDFDVFPD
jgi:hypothetical protein